MEDAAALVAWLLSAQAGSVTGQEFIVDGGVPRRMIYRDGHGRETREMKKILTGC